MQKSIMTFPTNQYNRINICVFCYFEAKKTKEKKKKKHNTKKKDISYFCFNESIWNLIESTITPQHSQWLLNYTFLSVSIDKIFIIHVLTLEGTDTLFAFQILSPLYCISALPLPMSSARATEVLSRSSVSPVITASTTTLPNKHGKRTVRHNRLP